MSSAAPAMNLRGHRQAGRRLLVLAAFLFFLQGLSAFAATDPEVFVPAHNGFQPLSVQLEYADDASGAATIDQVVAGEAGNFQNFDVSRHGWDYGKKVLWIRFRADMANHGETHWFLNQKYEHVARMTVFYPTESGYQALELDEQNSIANRPVNVHNYLFKIPTPTNNPATYYIRYEQAGHWLGVELFWSNTKGVIEHMHDTQLAYGLAFGSLLVMWFYNFILYLYTRNTAYFYYVYYLGFFIATFFYVSGLAALLFPSSAISEKLFSFSAYASLHGAILFGRRFLSLRDTNPRIDAWLRITQWSVACGAITVFFLPMGRPWQAIFYFTIPSAILLFGAGCARSLQGYVPGRIYTAGWTLVAVAVMIFEFKLVGLFPSNILTNNAIYFASVWEAVLFSLALAYRIKLADAQKSAELEKERNQLEQRVAERTKSLRTSLDARRMMIANASHELRTPVNTLRLLLDATALSGMRERDVLPRVNAIVKHMSELVENLLLLDPDHPSQLRSGLIQEFDLGAEIQMTVAIVRPLQYGSNVDFSADTGSCSGVMVRGNLTSLRRIIINLLSNAFKFTTHGKVELTAVAEHKVAEHRICCTIYVSDTGAGISKPMQEQLFEPFVTSSTPDQRTGTGLGLAISRQLALHLDGSLRLVRSDENRGSEFECIVSFGTALKSDARPVPNPDFSIDERSSRSLKVLVAEDDLVAAEAIQAIIQLLRHRIVHVATYSELHQLLNSPTSDFDVALIDHRLPGGNGLDAIKTCRANGNAVNTIMVLMTADAAPEVLNAARDICNEVIIKPTTAHRIRQLLGVGKVDKEINFQVSEFLDPEPLALLRDSGVPHMRLVHMCEVFSETVSTALGQIIQLTLRRNFSTSDSKSLDDIVHRMCGACATIGAVKLFREFKALPDCLDKSVAQAQLIQISETFLRTKSEFGTLLAKLEAIAATY